VVNPNALTHVTNKKPYTFTFVHNPPPEEEPEGKVGLPSSTVASPGTSLSAAGKGEEKSVQPDPPTRRRHTSSSAPCPVTMLRSWTSEGDVHSATDGAIELKKPS